MKRGNDRAEKLIDIGSTTALSSLVEIVSNKGSAPGILARQFKAMIARIREREDHGFLIEGFCGEIETFVESVPGARLRPVVETSRKRRAA